MSLFDHTCHVIGFFTLVLLCIGAITFIWFLWEEAAEESRRRVAKQSSHERTLEHHAGMIVSFIKDFQSLREDLTNLRGTFDQRCAAGDGWKTDMSHTLGAHRARLDDSESKVLDLQLNFNRLAHQFEVQQGQLNNLREQFEVGRKNALSRFENVEEHFDTTWGYLADVKKNQDELKVRCAENFPDLYTRTSTLDQRTSTLVNLLELAEARLDELELELDSKSGKKGGK